MIEFFQLMILYPFYLIGYWAGFVWRSIFRGFWGGFYAVELKARTGLTDELKVELDKYEQMTIDTTSEEVEESDEV